MCHIFTSVSSSVIAGTKSYIYLVTSVSMLPISIYFLVFVTVIPLTKLGFLKFSTNILVFSPWPNAWLHGFGNLCSDFPPYICVLLIFFIVIYIVQFHPS